MTDETGSVAAIPARPTTGRDRAGHEVDQMTGKCQVIPTLNSKIWRRELLGGFYLDYPRLPRFGSDYPALC